MTTENTAPRNFSDVINQWTVELLRLNKDATVEQVSLILRLGMLGQRLIYEANIIGQNEVLRFSAEQKVRAAAGDAYLG